MDRISHGVFLVILFSHLSSGFILAYFDIFEPVKTYKEGIMLFFAVSGLWVHVGWDLMMTRMITYRQFFILWIGVFLFSAMCFMPFLLTGFFAGYIMILALNVRFLLESYEEFKREEDGDTQDIERQ